jgi:serine/threonine protein kinase
MHRGSLRGVLNTPELWQQYTPLMRHQILCDVAEGMAYLHTQDTFHRDLKSHNVLITDNFRAVLTDFGLSKTAGSISGMTNTRSVFNGGTLAWTAPEIFNAKGGKSQFTAKSDVYSYGIVIYEVLAGSYAVSHHAGAELSNMPW